MLFRLLLLFTALPLVELVLLAWIKTHTSWTFTIALVFATGMLGAVLARWQGWQTVQRIQQEMAQGRIPTDALLDGLLILIAGAVLVTPGILSDAAGFLLLIPPCRQLVKRTVRRKLQQRMHVHTTTQGFREPDTPGTSRDRVIDVRVVDPHAKDPDKPQGLEG